MTKIHATLKTVAVLCFIIATCSFASAQATRTWVSGVGDDANPCSRTAPCKTWAGAISKTFIGGEIDALDPGGFGTVTITKSITLDGCCITSILASGTNGIVINITPNGNDPERRVVIRHITINGTGSSGAVGQRTGLKGISILQAGNVLVENCYINNFSQEGINANLTATGTNVSVKDTNIFNCNVGISVQTSTGFVLLTTDRARIERMSNNGITIGTHGFASIRDSFVLFNGADGIGMGATNNDGRVFVENSMVSHNPSAALRAGNAAADTVNPQLVVSNCRISSNGSAFATAGGTVGSHGNNSVDGTIGVSPTGLGQQ